MSGMKLIQTIKCGDVIVKRFIDENAMTGICCSDGSDGSDMGEITIYEKITKPAVLNIKHLPTVKFKKRKTEKLQKLSKLPKEFERIARQQLAERRAILKDYSISWEQWCIEQYGGVF